MAVNAGFFTSIRKPYRASWIRVSICHPLKLVLSLLVLKQPDEIEIGCAARGASIGRAT